MKAVLAGADNPNQDRFDVGYVLVRGTAKVTCVMLLGSLAFKLQHAAALLA